MEETFREDDLIEELQIRVDRGQSPLRIDRFLMDRLERLSRNKVQQGIRAGSIKVNQSEVKANYLVKPFDLISVIMPRSSGYQEIVEGQDLSLEIIYEDTDVLVLNKPVGLVVHPGVGNREGTLVHGLVHHLGRRDLPLLRGNPVDRPGLVHRLDKNTSGLLVVAKNDFSISHLARQFFDHSIDRVYYALVWGQPDSVEGTVHTYIGRDPKDRLKQKVLDPDQGKEAITHYRVLDPMYYVSLVECRLETGRTHQIRVHMQHLGHPVFGDERYGGDRIAKGTPHHKYRQFVDNCFELMPYHALHAGVLGFEHPVTGERMRFEVGLPESFRQVLERWRNYVHTRKSLL